VEDRIGFFSGNRPYAPVPITSWRHFQGISSSTDSGVCPKSSRNFLDGFLLEKLSKCMCASSDGVYALFLEVRTEKADHRCSTLWLPQ